MHSMQSISGNLPGLTKIRSDAFSCDPAVIRSDFEERAKLLKMHYYFGEKLRFYLKLIIVFFCIILSVILQMQLSLISSNSSQSEEEDWLNNDLITNSVIWPLLESDSNTENIENRIQIYWLLFVLTVFIVTITITLNLYYIIYVICLIFRYSIYKKFDFDCCYLFCGIITMLTNILCQCVCYDNDSGNCDCISNWKARNKEKKEYNKRRNNKRKERKDSSSTTGNGNGNNNNNNNNITSNSQSNNRTPSVGTDDMNMNELRSDMDRMHIAQASSLGSIDTFDLTIDIDSSASSLRRNRKKKNQNKNKKKKKKKNVKKICCCRRTWWYMDPQFEERYENMKRKRFAFKRKRLNSTTHDIALDSTSPRDLVVGLNNSNNDGSDNSDNSDTDGCIYYNLCYKLFCCYLNCCIDFKYGIVTAPLDWDLILFFDPPNSHRRGRSRTGTAEHLVLDRYDNKVPLFKYLSFHIK